jgi:hypothetical protein
VFRAHDPGNSRFVALKLFRLDLTADQTEKLAEALEALVNDQPRHPGIAAALSSGAEGRVAYLAQEYVAGEALDASLRQYGPPPIEAALITLGGMAEALDRAAGEGIHHGCLHPRDVIVTPSGEARVIDLGVAEALQRAGLRAPVRRPYSAPERVEGRSWGGPADIFALGAIAFELVTGRRVPGPGAPTLSTDGMSGLDQKALSQILGRALAPDPTTRFVSASDLVDVLRPVLARARRVTLARRRRATPEGVVPLPLDREQTAAVGEPEPEPVEAPPPAPIVLREPVIPVIAASVVPEPSVHHDPHDLPLTIAEAPPVIAPEPAPRRPRPPVEPELPAPASAAVLQTPAPPGATVLQGPTWRIDTPDQASRWSLATMLVTLIVGLSGGFGLGYWAAWRAAVREQPSIASAAQEPSAAPTRVDEPQVTPEAGSAATSSAAPKSATASSPSALPAPTAPKPQPPAQEPATPTTTERTSSRRDGGAPGKLLVRSSPAGARVTINGRVRGRTPLILRDLPLRVLTVTLTQTGYRPSEQRVALSAARPTATVEAKLIAESGETGSSATTGSLYVESRPSSARVFVDNRSIGSTPVSIPDLSPGYHRVRLELAGFTSWVTMAEVKVGARTRVSASLEQGQ